jgi:hypothetical protein
MARLQLIQAKNTSWTSTDTDRKSIVVACSSCRQPLEVGIRQGQVEAYEFNIQIDRSSP